jgi:peptide/nickel transport system permease protein
VRVLRRSRVGTLPGQPDFPENSDAAAVEPEHKSPSVAKLTWIRFRRNRLAVIGAIVLLVLYTASFVFPEFFAPYGVKTTSTYLSAIPQWPRFVDSEGHFSLRPFVYGYEQVKDVENFRTYYKADPSKKIYLHFFVKGEPYKLWGLFEADLHLYGPAKGEQPIFIFGTDTLGRDQFSRILHGGRISLSVGLVGVFFSLVLGVTLGTMSGYFGGTTDLVMQRIVELMLSFPSIPLWMALSVAVPLTWPPVAIYGAIATILSLIGWGVLARQIRGMALSLRERDFVLASKSFGGDHWYIIRRHLIPNMTSHIIVIATLAIPSMILGETALSFLGVGLRPPLTSWGILLKEAQLVRSLRFMPWTLIPTIFVVVTVLCYNFVGDGLRDAADPFSSR